MRQGNQGARIQIFFLCLHNTFGFCSVGKEDYRNSTFEERHNQSSCVRKRSLIVGVIELLSTVKLK